jgi:hypothetical protein
MRMDLSPIALNVARTALSASTLKSARFALMDSSSKMMSVLKLALLVSTMMRMKNASSVKEIVLIAHSTCIVKKLPVINASTNSGLPLITNA